MKPQEEAIQEGITKWSPSLVGQFLDKPLPFYIVKRYVNCMCGQIMVKWRCSCSRMGCICSDL